VATRAFACGDVILEESPLLVCHALEDLGAQWSENARAYREASKEIREKILQLLPEGFEEDHRLSRLATAVAGCVSDVTVSKEDMRRALLAFHLTSYELEGPEDLVGLFQTVSKFSHSCVPNAKGALHSPDRRSSVYALRPIAVGQEISLCYLSTTDRLRSVESRRLHLQAHKMFLCCCPACSKGSDSFRLVPCPRCHEREGSGMRLPAKIANEHQAVSYASLELASQSWNCAACSSSWTSEDFLEVCGREPADELRISSSIGDYLMALEADCFFGAPDHTEWFALRKEAASLFGLRHWTSMLLDLSMLDHLSLKLQALVKEGLRQDHDNLLETPEMLAEFEGALFSLLDRMVSALGSDSDAVALLWEDLWSAASIFFAFGRFEPAQKLLHLIRPFVERCADYLLPKPDFSATGAEAILALSQQIEGCRDRKGSREPLLVILRSPYFQGISGELTWNSLLI